MSADFGMLVCSDTSRDRSSSCVAVGSGTLMGDGIGLGFGRLDVRR